MDTYPKIIKLDVGGCKYKTTLTTLRKYPDSMLGCMFEGSFTTTLNDDGEFFIDANGEMFKYILDFLRRQKLMLPEDFKEFDLLLGEADFFQIQLLIHEINLLRHKRKPKEARTLLCVWVDRFFTDETGGLEDERVLHACYVKCSGLFEKIVRDDPSITTYENLCDDLKKEGYNLDMTSKKLPYHRLLSSLYTHGVTYLPKYEAEAVDSIDEEHNSYKFEIWTKICDKPS